MPTDSSPDRETNGELDEERSEAAQRSPLDDLMDTPTHPPASPTSDADAPAPPG